MKLKKAILFGLILALVLMLGSPVIMGAVAGVTVSTNNAPVMTAYLGNCTTLSTGIMRCTDPGPIPNVSWNS